MARRALRAATLVAFALSAGASEAQEPRVRLMLKARSGETYRAVMTTRSVSVITPPDAKTEVMHEARMETTVEGVDSGGRMKLRHRTIRFRTGTRMAGQLVDRFDSDKPDDVAAANADPERRKLIQELRQSVLIHQEPTGEIRRYESPHGTDPRLEQLMIQGNVLLPSHPVGPRDTWDGGTVTRPMAGVGRLVVSSKTTLSSVRQHDGELTAFFESRETVKLEPDEESGAKARLVSGDGTTSYELSVDRGRVRRMRKKLSLTIAMEDKGEPVRMTIELLAQLKEDR